MRKIILSATLGLLCAASVSAVQLSDIRNEVRFMILDTTTTSNNTRYSDAFLNQRINEAARELCRQTYPIYSKSLISAVTGQQEYLISTDTIKIDKVVFLINTSTSSYRKLVFSTIQSLDTDKGIMWESLPPGLPTNYYVRNNYLGIVQAPSSVYAVTNAIKVYYYKMPQDMMSDSDQPFDGIFSLQDYSNILVYGTAIKCDQDMSKPWADEQKTYDTMVQRMILDLSAQRPDSSVINVTK
jgi:hypothetical protein